MKLACQMGRAQHACCWAHLLTQLAPLVFATSPLWTNFCLQHVLLQIGERCWVILGANISMNEKHFSDLPELGLSSKAANKQTTMQKYSVEGQGAGWYTQSTPIMLLCYALSWFLMLGSNMHFLCLDGSMSWTFWRWAYHHGIGLFVRMGVTDNCVRQPGNQATIPPADKPEPDIRPPATYLISGRNLPLICIRWFLFRTLKKLAGASTGTSTNAWPPQLLIS